MHYPHMDHTDQMIMIKSCAVLFLAFWLDSCWKGPVALVAPGGRGFSQLEIC